VHSVTRYSKLQCRVFGTELEQYCEDAGKLSKIFVCCMVAIGDMLDLSCVIFNPNSVPVQYQPVRSSRIPNCGVGLRYRGRPIVHKRKQARSWRIERWYPVLFPAALSGQRIVFSYTVNAILCACALLLI
jgi:hypothetical protein